MEAALAHLVPGRTRLAKDTPKLDMISVTQTSPAPLSLVHPLMVDPFLLPSNECHMMHAKADAMGITQRVTSFMDCLRTATGKTQQGIAALTRVDLVKPFCNKDKVLRQAGAEARDKTITG